MGNTETSATLEPEFSALETVYAALKGLDAKSQRRVLIYVGEKLGLALQERSSSDLKNPDQQEAGYSTTVPYLNHEDEEGLNGISPIARKWMTRNGLTSKQLGEIYSLGIDEIDLVAEAVPGSSKKTKTRSVSLLKGIATYLSSGAARMSHEQIKEACLLYDAYDPANHAAYLKSFASEVSGNKENGYVLTPRGLASAAAVIKDMLKEK